MATQHESGIAWTDETWNPVTGCTKVSAGCANCYAERMHKRFSDEPFSVIKLFPDRLDQPLRWRKPRRIFVCSMGDLFHEAVPDEFIERVFKVMERSSIHTFQVLTKRPERMRRIVSSFPDPWPANQRPGWPLRNIWLGVSCENQAAADERIPLLLQTPAAVRFVSLEPLLGPVDIHPLWLGWFDIGYDHGQNKSLIAHYKSAGFEKPSMLDWVIAGSESGPKRRPAGLELFRLIKDQCVAAGVPFFLKQAEIAGKLVKMPELDGREWNEYPK